MEFSTNDPYIIIAPQIYVSLEPQETVDLNQDSRPRRTEIPMIWTQDGNDFRLDINLPDSSVLDVFFSSQVGSLHVNGETIWDNYTLHAVQITGTHAEVTPSGLRLTCTYSGSLHILARCIATHETRLPKKHI